MKYLKRFESYEDVMNPLITDEINDKWMVKKIVGRILFYYRKDMSIKICIGKDKIDIMFDNYIHYNLTINIDDIKDLKELLDNCLNFIENFKDKDFRRMRKILINSDVKLIDLSNDIKDISDIYTANVEIENFKKEYSYLFDAENMGLL